MKDPADFTLADIIERKQEARRERARMSFAEKVAVVERSRDALAPFNAARLRRQQAVPTTPTR
jgi:hypothetical protein